jgi:hypothetical protein
MHHMQEEISLPKNQVVYLIIITNAAATGHVLLSTGELN